MLLYKETKKLFYGKYQYKIILVASGVHVFRGGNIDDSFRKLSMLQVQTDTKYTSAYHLKSQKDLNYLFEIYRCFTEMTDYSVRVETPLLTVYTNNEADIQKLADIDYDTTKYIYKPRINLSVGEVVSILPYDYKVTVRSDTHDAFVEWAQKFDTIRMPNSCYNNLLSSTRWKSSESYFYITGEKTLTMAKIHLGSSIKKIEKIINP